MSFSDQQQQQVPVRRFVLMRGSVGRSAGRVSSNRARLSVRQAGRMDVLTRAKNCESISAFLRPFGQGRCRLTVLPHCVAWGSSSILVEKCDLGSDCIKTNVDSTCFTRDTLKRTPRARCTGRGTAATGRRSWPGSAPPDRDKPFWAAGFKNTREDFMGQLRRRLRRHLGLIRSSSAVRSFYA